MRKSYLGGLIVIDTTPPSESKRYRMALLDDDGNIVAKKTFKVYKDSKENSIQFGAMKGQEIAIDALYHAGWLEAK